MRAYIPGEQIYCTKVTFLRLAFELVLIFFLELHFLEYHEKSRAKLWARYFHFLFRKMKWWNVLHYTPKLKNKTSVIRGKGESQNEDNKKTKHAKIFGKRTFLIVCVSGACFAFLLYPFWDSPLPYYRLILLFLLNNDFALSPRNIKNVE